MGDPRTFHCAAAYEKACGLNLKEHSSGNPKHRGLHITQRGSSRARQYLYLFAMRWLQRDPAARAWAQHRQCWSRPGGKIGALVALMRKAARAVWHLSRGESYQASKLFDLRRLGLDASAGSQQEPVTERDDDDVTPGARADEASPSSRTESAPTCDTPSRRTATASASRDDTQTPHTASSTASRVHAASPMRAAAPTSSTPSSDDTMSTSLDDTAAQRTASPTTPQLRDAASTRAAIHASTDTATVQVETPTRDRRGRFQSRASTLASRDSSATTATPAATPPRSDEHTTRQPIAEAPALSPRTHGTSAPQKSRLTETMERVGRLMARGQ